MELYQQNIKTLKTPNYVLSHVNNLGFKESSLPYLIHKNLDEISKMIDLGEDIPNDIYFELTIGKYEDKEFKKPLFFDNLMADKYCNLHVFLLSSACTDCQILINIDSTSYLCYPSNIDMRSISQDYLKAYIQDQYSKIRYTSETFLVDNGKYTGSITYSISPLIVSKEKKTLSYKTCIHFNTGKEDIVNWSKQAQLGLLSQINQSLIDVIPESIKMFSTTFPQFTLIHNQNKNLVPVGIHLEKQKLRYKPTTVTKLTKDTENEKESLKIETIGVDITSSQNNALFAIQKLLHQTNFNGTDGESKYLTREQNSFKFEGQLPILKITPSEYLEAYGASKYFSKRKKMEFSGEARRQAFDALIALATKTFLFVYKRKYFDETTKMQNIDRIETISPLIKLSKGWEALTQYEDELLDQGITNADIDNKLKGLVIEPAPVFIDQIKSYFVLKPANFHQEIRLKTPKASKYCIRFVEYLLIETEQRRRHHSGLTIKINFLNLAEILRMDSYIKSRNKKRIRTILEKAYNLSIELGYLKKYETVHNPAGQLEILYLPENKM